jgi:N-acetylglucosaminyldiphosphoundecaprenol N-acetyl-beta-D-mannosaminyltransferase
MPIVAATLALAALVWAAIFAHRGSLLIGCGLCLAVGYVLGHEFWHAKVGPLPVTLDRLVLIALLVAAAIQWRIGRLRVRHLTRSDWAVVVLLSVVAMSALFSGQAALRDGATSKWGRLVTSFIIPAVLYVIVRITAIKPRDWSVLLAGFTVLGMYLGVTAILEMAACWPLVFPRYIADPDLGIHFGRARGPELNAASLGLYLTACCWCAWTWLGQATRRWQQLAIAVTLPIMALGVLLTYTRSTWLGLLVSGIVVVVIQIPRRWRIPTLATAVLGGLLLAAVSWSQLVGLQREGTAAESLHSVDQRTSFAYVSWQMFRDHPVFGVGFGRFYDRKLPYLSDRSQSFELESIRPLHHHNTLLSVLTETGLVGFAAFATVLIVWVREAWLLAHTGEQAPRLRAQGILMLALISSYLCSAVFHDLTLVPSQHWLLFAFAGLTVSMRQDRDEEAAIARKLSIAVSRVVPDAGFAVDRQTDTNSYSDRGPTTTWCPRPSSPVRESAVGLFGMQISYITMRETIEQLLTWCEQPRRTACRYVVTPNVDHAVLFQRRADLRAAYADASLVLADGAPIVLASKLLGLGLPERVAGSDLVPRLFESSRSSLRVYLLGAAPGVAEVAATQIAHRCPKVRVVGTYAPPVGFEHDDEENARILAAISAAQPDLLIIGFGAPKQELWVHRHQHQLHAKVAICAGATIDFLAGQKRRSPMWMRRLGLEWLHRVATEPQRLAARYARDAWVFPQLVWRQWRQSHA